MKKTLQFHLLEKGLSDEIGEKAGEILTPEFRRAFSEELADSEIPKSNNDFSKICTMSKEKE